MSQQTFWDSHRAIRWEEVVVGEGDRWRVGSGWSGNTEIMLEIIIGRWGQGTCNGMITLEILTWLDLQSQCWNTKPRVSVWVKQHNIITKRWSFRSENHPGATQPFVFIWGKCDEINRLRALEICWLESSMFGFLTKRRHHHPGGLTGRTSTWVCKLLQEERCIIISCFVLACKSIFGLYIP